MAAAMRVIAGRLGGRRLVAPRGRSTRPTSDRVREALFSMLGDVTGARVLDVYAGTGALGIEALSRGAARATFVESARPALAALRENLASLGLGDAARVVPLPAERAHADVERDGPFELVLADPPYDRLGEAASFLLRLASAPGALAEGVRVVLEHAARAPAPALPPLEHRTTRTYGDTAVSLYVRGCASTRG